MFSHPFGFWLIFFNVHLLCDDFSRASNAQDGLFSFHDIARLGEVKLCFASDSGEVFVSIRQTFPFPRWLLLRLQV